MSEENPYTAPESALYETRQTGEYGSVERGLAGDYQITIGGVISEAWAAIKGQKLLLNGAGAVLFMIVLVYIAVAAAIDFALGVPAGEASVIGAVLDLLINLAYYAIYGVTTAGLVVLGAKVSMHLPAGVAELFRFTNKLLKALATYILMVIMVLLGFVLLVIPGIYLSVAYLFALPLAVEKNLSPWQALETSRKAVTHRWFTVAGAFLVLTLFSVLGVLTLGIAFIWLFPLYIVAYGILYRDIFGLEQDTLSS